MEFFNRCMESVFSAMNVRRSGPEDEKQTYIDMTMMVEIPKPDIVAAIDVSLVALLFDNARMAINAATPSDKVHFPRQDISLATRLFEEVDDVDVALAFDAAVVKVKSLIPADDDGHGAKMKLQFSIVSPSKRELGLLAELIGEPVWFMGNDSATQDLPKKKGKKGKDVHAQDDLFACGVTEVEIRSGDQSVTLKSGDAKKLRAIK